jgi:serine phosphatase RsbU (regulator of sigma subunit)
MQDLTERINQALEKEEARAERFANNVRLILLILLTAVAVLNMFSVSREANLMNFGVLGIGYTYGFLVVVFIRRSGYHPMMKYVTSCLDVALIFVLLILYARIEIPSVALKNYVFLALFPLVALTAFRYDRMLTLVAGGLAVALYVIMFFSLYLSHSITVVHGGYAQELFSSDITYIGQFTKVLILCGYVLLLSYLAKYSRGLFAKLITNELHVRNQKELIDWELKIASQVQTQFLPHSFPEIPGLQLYGSVQQGKFVGGDYFDFIKLADDTLLVVVADVSGKGVPASLIMAEVRASTQLLASMHADLEQFTQQLNSLVHQSTDKKNFVTFFAAEINTSQRRLTYVNAGHPPPLISSKQQVRSLKKGTLPLGLYGSLPHLVKHSEDFKPGDTVIMYTDGIVERTNLLGEQFGEERLLDYVHTDGHNGAQELARQLFDEVRDFGQGKEPDDDVTLAVVKYTTDSNT